MSWTVPEGEVQLYAEVTDDSRYATSGTFVDAPAWDEQPTSLVAHVGDEGLALKAKASVSDGEVSYQWFRAGAEDFSDATPAPEVSSVDVEGVAALELEAGTEGVAYYRVKATNAVAKWNQTRSSLSDLVKVEILPAFKGCKKLKKATVLAKQLDKKSCKNMKKGTKLKKVKLKGAAKASKKAYKKYFGKKVKVK